MLRRLRSGSGCQGASASADAPLSLRIRARSLRWAASTSGLDVYAALVRGELADRPGGEALAEPGGPWVRPCPRDL
jgi:hypothetical protein